MTILNTSKSNDQFFVLPDDSADISCPSQPCATLSQYLLDNNGTLPVVSNVEYHFLPGEHVIPANLELLNIKNFTFVGIMSDNLPLVVLVSPSRHALLYIKNSSEVTISNLKFKNHNQLQQYHRNLANILLFGCSFCKIENVSFIECGIALQNLLGESYLHNIRITNPAKATSKHSVHEYGIVLKYNDQPGIIHDYNNNSIEINNLVITGKGNAGIMVLIVQSKYDINISIFYSLFYEMDQPIMHISVVSVAQIQVKNCTFIASRHMDTHIIDPMIKIVMSPVKETIKFLNCNFHHNYDWKSLLSILILNLFPLQICANVSNISLQGCNFTEIGNPILYLDKTRASPCTVNLAITGPFVISEATAFDTEDALLNISDATVSISGPITFSHNYAYGIISFQSSDVLLSEEIVFISNEGNAMIVTKSEPAYVKVLEYSNITFTTNIYYNNLVLLEPDERNNFPFPFCILQYVTLRNKPFVTPTHYTITAKNNHLEEFLIPPSDQKCEFNFHHFTTHCQWIPSSVFYGHNPGVINQQIIQTDQLSHHTIICYCSHNITNCSVDVLGLVYPGQVLQVELCVTTNNEHSILYVETHNTHLPNSSCKVAHQTELVSTITNYSKMFNFTIIVTEAQQTCEIFLTASPCLYSVYEAFYVEILPCPVGFTLQNGVCDCDPYLSDSNIHIDTCYIDQSTITRPANTWITAHYYSNNTKYLISHNCPMDYCLPHSSHLNLHNPDLQCQFNRTSILCSQCQHSLSIVFGSSRCIHCTNIHILITIIVILAGIVLVVLLYLLNLTVTNGTINGIIFYANIISINDSVFLVNDNVFKPLRVFISFANLDLGIETCFYNGMDGYAKAFLQLFFPFYLIVIAVSIIVTSHYSSRILRWTYTRSLPVLATLFLLSYTSVLRAVLTVLFSYSTITQLPSGDQQLVWSIDASVPLFGVKFTILFITCLVLFLLLIPFNIILLFTRYLSQFRIISQFKPLLDAFQGSYKDKYYYWVGVHLIFRSMCFALYGFQVKSRLVLSAILLIIFSILNGCIYPNRKKPVNIQELLLLINLTIMYAVSYQGSGSVFSIVTNVMISLAFIQFCTIVFYHFLTYTCHCNVVTTLQTVKEKLMEYRRNDDHIDLGLLNIPERTHNYNEYRDGLVSDDFERNNLPNT